ncbi:hypothetical protein J3Q64DRAFT_1695058 [Phycomyces blakesleeanus]|uniref:Uncharacterized protein n=2 Tax=Phycomyces blakesleeanus TaxID=4837 RepID=A0A167PT26_PHYB8|nr:hypothetical protein PHYBLDRAFT_62748 [Phycomyces blakesleeanus NRRL 1555(-)]OAD78487.1 hypothetical protein PHYBLDRAFT_62748 [Phycomyces blakesleeanus NRRL 1555(-)]|eukprot:XP_018296527.1 hypothetical protein PHYBLDRAFT_62748 [Phycomyces blakesleeanus NRRL 1555(-)]
MYNLKCNRCRLSYDSGALNLVISSSVFFYFISPLKNPTSIFKKENIKIDIKKKCIGSSREFHQWPSELTEIQMLMKDLNFFYYLAEWRVLLILYEKSKVYITLFVSGWCFHVACIDLMVLYILV